MAFLISGTRGFILLLGYGWRNQIGPWVRKGYRVVVPDMLGYGHTDKPHDPSEYSTKKLCADLAALLDILNVQRAVVIGHDWGAFTAARFALWYPDRLLSLIILSVPYTPPSRAYMSPDDVARLAPNLGYQADFANPASTTEIENNLSKFLSLIFRAPPGKENFTHRGYMLELSKGDDVQKEPSVLSDTEYQVYLDAFRKGGMNGPLNYYRTSKHRHEEEQRAGLPSHLPSNLPILFIWGTHDPTCTPFVISKSKKFIKFQDVAFEGKGHWLLVEAKEEVTEKVLSWLKEVQTSVAGKL
ncbi:hypothetical protein H0H92_000354 [Tricholoma furcatifolium]|nr:hypothetical protein H0H92_000354 [Tricholoma furcatifolium]